MSKEIEPFMLSRHLYRDGPYIYFFKADNDGKNNSIVAKMNEEAIKYPKLTVFKINWEKQILFNCLTNLYHKNTIFLYFRAKSVNEVFEPNKDQITEFFKIGLGYYKMRLELKFRKQGCHSLKNQNFQNLSIETPENKIKNFDKIRSVFYRKRNFALQWKKIGNNNIETNLGQTFKKYLGPLIKEPHLKIEKFVTTERNYVQNLVLDQIKLSNSIKTANGNILSTTKQLNDVSNSSLHSHEFLPNSITNKSKSINKKNECIHIESTSNLKNNCKDCPPISDSSIFSKNLEYLEKFGYKYLVKPEYSNTRGLILQPLNKNDVLNSNMSTINTFIKLQNTHNSDINESK